MHATTLQNLVCEVLCYRSGIGVNQILVYTSNAKMVACINLEITLYMQQQTLYIPTTNQTTSATANSWMADTPAFFFKQQLKSKAVVAVSEKKSKKKRNLETWLNS